MVAPNSPSARPKDSSTPVTIPGSISGRVMVAKIAPAAGAERRRRLLQPPVHRFDRQPDRALHQRKAHDAAAIAAPVQRKAKTDAERSDRARRR